MGNMIKATLYSVAFLSTLITVKAQTLSNQSQEQISSYEEALNTALEADNFSNAAGISGKMAYIYWNNGLNNEAIDYFERSIEYNQKTGNKNGIKSAYYNLGLVRIDNKQYDGALADFENGIKLAKELGQKNEILSGLINAASVSQSSGKNKEAVAFAEEALVIAKELDNINLTKRCYGILYESYQALGNSEKSIEYFDLYSTVDKFLKNEQVKQIESESQQKVEKIASEKAQTDRALANSNEQLQFTQDSLQVTREITEKQKLQLELNESVLREKEAQLENERLIRKGLIIITGLTFLFLIILYVQYRQKKKKNILLKEQNDQIKQQKEEIESQGEILSIKNEELIAVNKEKNLMMSMVAHDLKKPINDLTSLSQILDQFQDKLPDDFNNLVSVLKKNSSGYRQMVHKVLDAGAIESRKLNVVQEQLSIREVLKGNVESQSLAASDKKIEFDLSEAPFDSFIKADKIYLAQAIENVLYNAVKYSPKESTIYLGAKKVEDGFELFIKDEGPGITPDDKKYLFETFKPLKNGDIESTGLGLSISKKYIEAMDGDIRCESEVDQGTTFFFKLPGWS